MTTVVLCCAIALQLVGQAPQNTNNSPSPRLERSGSDGEPHRGYNYSFPGIVAGETYAYAARPEHMDSKLYPGPRHLPRLLADQFVWNQLCTALDIIDDAESALTAYTDNDFPTQTGEKYLRIYGAMQGLFLQQDALRDLIKAIHPTKEIPVNDMLRYIREARNASVGHPTRLGWKAPFSTHGIVQHSMRKEGFELVSYPKKNDETFEHVPVQELIEKQRAEATRILSEAVEELRGQEEAHRAQFRENKLVKVFNQVSYAFEKIFEAVRIDPGPNLSNWAIHHLYQSLADFERLLKERGLGVDSVTSIKYLYGEIEHPLTELRKFLRREPSEVLSNKSAAVFTEALRHYFDDLRNIAREIDEEYSSEPDPDVKPEYSGPPMTFTITHIGRYEPRDLFKDMSYFRLYGKRFVG